MATAEKSPGGSWLWSEAHGAAGWVVQVDYLWEETVNTLWLPYLSHLACVRATVEAT